VNIGGEDAGETADVGTAYPQAALVVQLSTHFLVLVYLETDAHDARNRGRRPATGGPELLFLFTVAALQGRGLLFVGRHSHPASCR
jgi:hypothetical protein